jgi:hypothetical protein
MKVLGCFKEFKDFSKSSRRLQKIFKTNLKLSILPRYKNVVMKVFRDFDVFK